MKNVPFTFGGLRKPFCDYKTARYAVLPVPYEKTTSYLKGTAKGPKAILDASRYLELYDEELDMVPAEAGIATLKPLAVSGGPESMMAKVKASTLRLLQDGKFPVILGGEHSISPAVAWAAAEHHGEISVLQFDAHSDLRESYNGSRYSHACAMARAREHADTVHVGIRSVGWEEADLVKELRSRKKLYFAKDILDGGRTADIVGALRKKVFITFDVDCLDPSIMPSTGTPEPGGLGWYDALAIIRAVTRERTVVGFDVMELCPNRSERSSDFTAAKLAYKTMGYVLDGERR
jgi:agmatinase